MGRIVQSAAPARRVRRGPKIGEADAQAKSAGGGDDGEEGDTTKPGDGYLERVAKYVPAEIVAFFIFVNALLSDAVSKQMPDATNETYQALLTSALNTASLANIRVEMISWIVIAVALATTPLYLLAMRDPDNKREFPGLNIVMALLAFPVWAYAVDAVAFRRYHDGVLASILLATFTVVSGAITPDLLSSWKKADEQPPPGS